MSSHNIATMIQREQLRISTLRFISTIRRLGICEFSVTLHIELIKYWERECNATEEDLYKTDGARRASK